MNHAVVVVAGGAVVGASFLLSAVSGNQWDGSYRPELFFSKDAPAFSRGKAHTIHDSLCFVSFSVIVVSDFQTAFGVRVANLRVCGYDLAFEAAGGRRDSRTETLSHGNVLSDRLFINLIHWDIT